MRGKYKFYIWIVGFVSMFLHGKTDAQQALYPLLEKKSWSQVLEEKVVFKSYKKRVFKDK